MPTGWTFRQHIRMRCVNEHRVHLIARVCLCRGREGVLLGENRKALSYHLKLLRTVPVKIAIERQRVREKWRVPAKSLNYSFAAGFPRALAHTLSITNTRTHKHTPQTHRHLTIRWQKSATRRARFVLRKYTSAIALMLVSN